MNNFLEFYGQNQISPVSQNVDDLAAHSGRRLGLYRTLGLARSTFAGRDVLEVAPGSGHNAIVTATLNAKRYDLVEPNPTGYQTMLRLFEKHRIETENVRFFNARLEEFAEKDTYDIVLCEGLIPGLSNPDELLAQLVQRVRSGGVLVVTCADAVSAFFESLCRYVARLLIRNVVSNADGREGHTRAVSILLPAFGPHLAALRGMSRPPEDWIWDNLLNPAAANLAASHEFSVEECFNAFGADFYFYGSSPTFMTNWTWYKNLPLEPARYNDAFLASFRAQRQNLLHCEETALPDESVGTEMYASCRAFSLLVERPATAWQTITPEVVREDLTHVERVAALAERCGLRRSAAALREFLDLFAGAQLPDVHHVAAMKDFRGAFGRGQQYVSLVRR